MNPHIGLILRSGLLWFRLKVLFLSFPHLGCGACVKVVIFGCWFLQQLIIFIFWGVFCIKILLCLIISIWVCLMVVGLIMRSWEAKHGSRDLGLLSCDWFKACIWFPFFFTFLKVFLEVLTHACVFDWRGGHGLMKGDLSVCLWFYDVGCCWIALVC